MSSIKNKISEYLSNKGTIAVWGAGGLSSTSLKYFIKNEQITKVFDIHIYGTMINGIPVICPSKEELEQVDVLVICSAAHQQIKSQAQDLGFSGEIYYIYELIAEIYKDSSNELDFLKLDIIAVKNSNIIRLLIDKPQILVNITFRTARYLSKYWYLTPVYWVMYLIHAFVCLLTSVQLPLKTEIGPGFGIAHYGTIVFSQRAKIGSFFTIYHGCTVGTNFTGKAPVIGDFVTQYAGSHVLGNTNIANNCVIGANSVVLDLNTQEGDTIVGLPAKIKRKL